MRSRIFSILASLVLGAGCAHAQFIGYVSPQTTQQTLATGVACTGVAQNFPVNNLGQTQHYLSIISTGSQILSAQLQGIDRAGNVFAISDVIEVPSGAGGRRGTIFGTGYFPQIQVTISCLPSGGGATFTLSYSGAWGTFNSATGDYLAAQLDKTNFTNSPGNANANNFFQTPFANALGTLFFQYNGAAAGGGSITVQCQASGIGTAVTVFTAPLANNSLVQAFQIPPQSCSFATVFYTNSGAAGTVTSDYVFAEPGQQTPAQQYTHVTGTTATAVKATPGYLHTVTINTGGAGTLSVFDLATAACTGTPATNTVAVITAVAATLQTFTYDVNLLNGICVKASAAMDFTVSAQ
jgi:hypothetical protein